jgi:adenosylhomocysteine nucleosidase
MKILVIIPTQKEYDYFLNHCFARQFQTEKITIGKLPVVRFPDLNMTVSRGGLGKVQFAVHTQHLLDSEFAWDLVICAGAAGSLDQKLSVGDIVVGTETVEHDIRNRFGKPLVPRFKGDNFTINILKQMAGNHISFQLHFGSIASGDEDVVDVKRQEEIRLTTAALAVAWEGAGGARACQFCDTPFIEIRGISDDANGDAPTDFAKNLQGVMENVALTISSMAKQFNE